MQTSIMRSVSAVALTMVLAAGASAAPHSPQNRRSELFSWSQDGQRIADRLACAAYHDGLKGQNEHNQMETDTLAGNGTDLDSGATGRNAAPSRRPFAPATVSRWFGS